MEKIEDGILAFQYNLANYLKDRFNYELKKINNNSSLNLLMDYEPLKKKIRLYFDSKDYIYDIEFTTIYKDGLNGFLSLGTYYFNYLGNELTKNQYYAEFLRVLKIILTELYSNRKFYQVTIDKSVINFVKERISLFANRQTVIYSY